MNISYFVYFPYDRQQIIFKIKRLHEQGGGFKIWEQIELYFTHSLSLAVSKEKLSKTLWKIQKI